MAPRVFTIPASAPFLPTLIAALNSGQLGFEFARDPLKLAATTLYLPTRRACRLARDAFLDVLAGDAAVLPRIVAIGDIDEDEIAFAEAAAGALAAEALTFPEALDPLERRLLLAQMVMKWAASAKVRGAEGSRLVAETPAAACTLADDLARLIDDMTMRGVPWTGLDHLVDAEFDKYWQLTLEFLKLARDAWPKILNAHRAIEAVERRDHLIKAEAARLAAKKDGPVIAAGSTGSIPATAELIATIARLPHGAVVLPGLDTNLDEASWKLIGSDPPAPSHPQFAMQALLARIGIARDAVTPLAEPCGREWLVSEAMRPAATTEMWRKHACDADFQVHVDAALKSMTVIEAAHAEEEALAIAVALREAVEHGKTASLVTPDRALGRRVLAALQRWNITAEDSGGDALADTPAGVFARLAAEAALEGLPPVSLLALLKHPLLRLGLGDHERDRALTALERAILRGPRPRRGSRGLTHALSAFRATKDKLHPSDPRRDVSDRALDAAADLLVRLTNAVTPLESLGRAPLPLAVLAERHRTVLAALAHDGGDAAVFNGADGSRLAIAFDDLAASTAAAELLVDPSDYVELFTAALAGRVVRRQPRAGARIRIFGLLEARLTKSDRIVLGGLVEGTWPPESRSDAWLSRPMRLNLGLDLPERRIGLTAHDFAQLLGAPEVIITLAAKVGGAPTVPSRFIQRLAAVAGERWDEAIARGSTYLAFARELDRPEQPPQPAPRPAPTPPLAARPTGLSVTDIEHWLRDPYTIYAKHILRLKPLDSVDAEPGAAERGTFIHAAIGRFTDLYKEALPADPVAALIALGREHFGELEDFPEARAFWWPRFERIVRWFAGWEIERRPAIAAIDAEIKGKHEIIWPEGSFTLRGVADRIERQADGRYVIFDYKTGSARTEKQVRTGLAPQLTLEAAILREGGFPNIPGGSVKDIAYVLLKGGEPPGDTRVLSFKEGSADSHAERALEKLKQLAKSFANESMPYYSLVHPMWSTYYGAYDHLARVKEWSSVGRDDDDFWNGA
jgi:ATP-dependent helicase/nuclease subunit B